MNEIIEHLGAIVESISVIVDHLKRSQPGSQLDARLKAIEERLEMIESKLLAL